MIKSKISLWLQDLKLKTNYILIIFQMCNLLRMSEKFIFQIYFNVLEVAVVDAHGMQSSFYHFIELVNTVISHQSLGFDALILGHNFISRRIDDRVADVHYQALCQFDIRSEKGSSQVLHAAQQSFALLGEICRFVLDALKKNLRIKFFLIIFTFIESEDNFKNVNNIDILKYKIFEIFFSFFQINKHQKTLLWLLN